MDSFLPSAIWTQCAGKSNLHPITATAWRVVEDQSKVATRKLVDSDDEQQRLEELIESVKPPLPEGEPWAHLHYLLATPFRYPPLSHGSRFRRAIDPGVWYGASSDAAALAETAFYRLRFLNDTYAVIRSEVVFTVFSVVLKTPRGVDLTAPPFAAYINQISSKTTYQWSQPLGQAMRQDGVQVALYQSARDPHHATNVAVFSPEAFAKKSVPDTARDNWYCFATKTDVEFMLQRFSSQRRLRFTRQEFEVDGILPTLLS